MFLCSLEIDKGPKIKINCQQPVPQAQGVEGKPTRPGKCQAILAQPHHPADRRQEKAEAHPRVRVLTKIPDDPQQDPGGGGAVAERLRGIPEQAVADRAEAEQENMKNK